MIAVLTLFIIIYAVFKGDKHSNRISFFGVAFLLVSIFTLEKYSNQGTSISGYLVHIKQIICFLSALCCDSFCWSFAL